MQVEHSIEHLTGLKKQLKTALERIDELREDTLMMRGAVEDSITQHEVCKNGLEAYVVSAQDEYTKELRLAAESIHELFIALMLPGVPPAMFPTLMVSQSGRHDTLQACSKLLSSTLPTLASKEQLMGDRLSPKKTTAHFRLVECLGSGHPAYRIAVPTLVVVASCIIHPVIFDTTQTGLYTNREPRMGSDNNPLPLLVDSVEAALNGRYQSVGSLLMQVQRCAKSMMESEESKVDESQVKERKYPSLVALDEALALYKRLWVDNNRQVRQ